MCIASRLSSAAIFFLKKLNRPLKLQDEKVILGIRKQIVNSLMGITKFKKSPKTLAVDKMCCRINFNDENAS
jgi:hypothetical protein